MDKYIQPLLQKMKETQHNNHTDGPTEEEYETGCDEAEREKRYKCLTCYIEFDDQEQLERHLLSDIHQEREEIVSQKNLKYRPPPSGVWNPADLQLCYQYVLFFYNTILITPTRQVNFVNTLSALNILVASYKAYERPMLTKWKTNCELN